MTRTCTLLLFVFLGACATTAVPAEPSLAAPPSHSAMMPPPRPVSLPALYPERDEGGAPDELSLPTGFGMTVGPTMFLLGTTLDIPIDKQITFGPSLQLAMEEDVDLASLSGQIKYFLPVIRKEKSTFSMLPYITAGVGVVRVDKEGSSSDSGLAFNAGMGVRFLSGEHYRIGSEARLNFMPDEVAGEEFYLSIELLQIVITF